MVSPWMGETTSGLFDVKGLKDTLCPFKPSRVGG